MKEVLSSLVTRDCLTVLTLRDLIVVRLDEDQRGNTVATYPWATEYANNIASPAVLGNTVLITSGYNQSSMCKLRINLSGAEVVWKRDHVSKACTPVIFKGKVYWGWRGLHCIDYATGRELWSGGRIADTASCVITNDARLVVWANVGDLFLVETAERSEKAYRELATNRLTPSDTSWPHMAIAEGKLFCKDHRGQLFAIEL